jgi:hypothetical protein
VYHLQRWRVDKFGRAVDGLVVRLFTGQVERAEDSPRDVIGQTGKDLGVIILAKAVQVGGNRLDVVGHMFRSSFVLLTAAVPGL